MDTEKHPTSPDEGAFSTETGARIRGTDWSESSLGASATWPQGLRSVLKTCMAMESPAAIHWGSDLVLLYNDAWSDLLGVEHPGALGSPARQIGTLWQIMGPSLERVVATGQASLVQHTRLGSSSRGFGSGHRFDLTCSPVPAPDGSVAGVLSIATGVSGHAPADDPAVGNDGEKDFRKMVNSLPTAIYTTDAQGRLTHFNSAAVEFSGRVPELGTVQWCVSWKLYHPDGTPMPHDQCPMAIALKEGRSIRGAEAVAERPDGTRITFEAYPSPLFDGEGRVIGGINMLVDVTERKRAEERLRQNERRLSDFFENATVPLHWVGPEGNILRANRAELDLLGYSEEEYVGRPIADFHADQEAIDEILERLKAAEEIHDYEARLRCKDGSLRHVLISSDVFWKDGEFVHTRCFTRDVTERKRSEQLLLEQKNLLELIASGAALEECFRALCAAVPTLDGDVRASIVVEDAQGQRQLRPIACDSLPSFARNITDEPVDLTLGTSDRSGYLSEMVVCEDLADDSDWPSDFRTSLLADDVRGFSSTPITGTSDEPWGSFILCFDAARGPSAWERQVSTFGAHIAGVALERDRTHQKEVQARREAEAARVEAETARKEAEEANQTKTQFLATISHELRTPLNAILGYADLLDANVAGSLTEGQQFHLDRIDTSARHLLQLIEEILSFSRIEAGREQVRAEEIDAAELVRSTAALVEPLTRNTEVAFSVRVPDDLGTISTDPAKVRQILLNLLSNAIKFTEEGAVEVEARETTDGILLRVRDTGVGIEPEKQSSIFEPFTQAEQLAERSEGGTGLGLSVARRLAHLLGGEIELESEFGKGSTFTVQLPRTVSSRTAHP